MSAMQTYCEWFALCDRAATGTTPHPILGAVPTCDRCHEFATGEERSIQLAGLGELRASSDDDGAPCEPGGETLLDRAMRDA